MENLFEVEGKHPDSSGSFEDVIHNIINIYSVIQYLFLKGGYQTEISTLPTFFFESPRFYKKLNIELKFWELK